MSIRSIDTQIMVQRTTDVAREASVLQKNPEVAQQHLATQGKADSALAQSRVVATGESEMDNIHTDADGSGSGAGGEGSGSGGKKRRRPGDDELLVPASKEIKFIDITI